MTPDEEAIRRDERRRLASLLEDHAETLSTFAGEASSRATIGLVVFLLRLNPTAAQIQRESGFDKPVSP